MLFLGPSPWVRVLKMGPGILKRIMVSGLDYQNETYSLSLLISLPSRFFKFSDGNDELNEPKFKPIRKRSRGWDSGAIQHHPLTSSHDVASSFPRQGSTKSTWKQNVWFKSLHSLSLKRKSWWNSSISQISRTTVQEAYDASNALQTPK